MNGSTSSSVSPIQPIRSKTTPDNNTDRENSTLQPDVFQKQKFHDVYGSLGVVMLVAFSLASLTMAYEAVVQIVPNWTANFLMGTIFACLYLYLIAFMLSYNKESAVRSLMETRSTNSLLTRIVLTCQSLFETKRVHNQTIKETRTVIAVAAAMSRSKSLKAFAVKVQQGPVLRAHRVNKLIHNILNTDGKYYRYFNASLDFPKLIFQTMSLDTFLNKGFRLSIIIFYAVPLGINWLVSFYRFQRTRPDPFVLVGRTVSLFDLFFSVFSPIMMLIYAYRNFDMDRARYATVVETLTPGMFDRIARLFADPIQMELLKSSFANLQVTEGLYIFVKCFLNGMGVYKWRKLIKHLILRSRSTPESGKKSVVHPHSRALFSLGATIFLSCCVGIAVYTSISIYTSVKNCSPYVHCAVYSYRWDWKGSGTCPCLVFIDRELSPLTYNEWMNADDVTDTVRALAASGYLQTIQIVNRALPELPEELRLSKNLKDLILVYTKTRRFPDWMKEFAQMQYFHVENDFIHSGLQYLPQDMFTGMTKIRFIRTGGCSSMIDYPSLKGLKSLSTLVMTIVRQLTELPSLDDLSGLTTLYIAEAIHVHKLPSLTGLTNLKNFALFRRNQICCDGYVTGYCDLNNFQCLPRPNEPAVTCTTDRIPTTDLALIQRIDGFLCGKNITQDLEASEPTLESTDGVCQGVLYRECYLNGIRGICYNGRMQVIHCDVFGEYERMRRLQIRRGAVPQLNTRLSTWKRKTKIKMELRVFELRVVVLHFFTVMMASHHRRSFHDAVPRLTSSECDQVLGQTDEIGQTSLDAVSGHGLESLGDLITSMDSLYLPPSCPTSVNAQVKPLNSSERKPSIQLSKTLRVVYFKESFYEVYGYLGLVMLVAFTLSCLAMVYMTVVQIIPNWTANFLMNTETLDNGEFLLMSKPSLTIVVTSALMLSMFACLYLWLIIFMLSYNSEATVNTLAQSPDPNSLSYRLTQKFLPLMKRVQAQTGGDRRTSITNVSPRTRSFETLKNLSAKIQRTSTFSSNSASKLIQDFTSMEGTYHRYYDALLDFPKLIFQTMSLATYLSKGFPLPIIFFYVLPLGFNWLVSFYRFQRSKPDAMLVVARVFYLFDLFFAVFAPIVMLVYSYYNFHLDREMFRIREETLTPGTFDRIARLFADPFEVQLVKTSFTNLQIIEGEYILVKCFLNLLGIYKWKKVIAHLILANRSRREDKAAKSHAHHPHSRIHTMVGGFIFVCCSVGIAIYTGLAISTSINSCAPYHHCQVYSYQWDWGHKTSCPCIVFIDTDLAPKTYDEWINAPDVTESLRAMAMNGHLETIQIVNRALPELPEELRLCHELKELILIYTTMQRIPDWAKEFTSLQYLHTESNFFHSSLQYIPLDLFTTMPNLRFIRTGGASGLTEYPSLKGLTKLSTLVMTIVRQLKELPSLDDLSGLTTLYIADAIHAHKLPSLTGLTNLKNFALFRRNQICCDGYVTGYCDLNNFQCLPRPNEPAVTCTTDRIPTTDLALIQRIDGFLCGKNITQDLEASEPTLESTDGVCQGVLYRECYLNGIRGICYNGRMQVIHCDVFGEYEKMRRLQISRGADECDPVVEQWLGSFRSSHSHYWSAMLRVLSQRLLSASGACARSPRFFHASATALHVDASKFAGNPTVHIKFKLRDDTVQEVEAKTGMSILDVAHANDIDLEGACESSMACSTCHVILEDPVFDELEEACEDEEDMLDMAFGLTDTSRLGCQVFVDESFEGTTVTLPKATRNFYVDGHVPKPH
ncbi:Adrenodoxin-like protein 1 [Phytophthora citrophthora]|uniref:2Fe-2S ferredoxin n=1 Tax=Phytophthora citrophthora TaxID=4793 RepID=A0AAD9G5Q2_9STRA|nr:Adrenodoxin-like protein 1 [Phytophthora citrophthora]